jgi:uncharacterized membrane protein
MMWEARVVLRKQSDLLLGMILTLIFFGLVGSGYFPLLRVVLSLPFVLLVPGNALAGVIFAGKNLRGVEKLLFALGFSLAAMVITGLVLNLTPWGLQTNSWLMALSIVTLIASPIAMGRRRQEPIQPPSTARFSMSFRQVLFLSLAALLISLALGLTFTPSPPNNIQGYTALWISPEAGDQPGAILIGVHSQEFETTHYQLRVTHNGQLQQEWPNISLSPGEQWQQSIDVPAGPGLVEATLFRSDSPEVVYRHVSTTLSK